VDDSVCVSFSFIRDPTAVVPVVLMGVSVSGLGSALVMSGSVTNSTADTRSCTLSVGHSQNLLFITNSTLRLHNNTNKNQMTDQLPPIHVKVKVKFTLEQATKAQRWSRGIALLFP